MGFDEQRTTTLAFEGLNHFPGVGFVFLRIGADQRNALVTQVRRCPHRAKFGVLEVGTAPRVGDFADIDDGFKLAFLGVDHHDLVRSVGSGHEVAARSVKTAVVQVFGRIDLRGLQVGQVGVIDHPHFAGFFGVNQELRLVVAGNDGRHPGFGVVLVVDVHAAGADHFFGLQGVAIHQHELGRPVGAGNGNLVFPAFELGGFHRAGFQTDFDLSDVVGFFHPQVDQVQAGIAANHVQVAARSGQARDVHGVAGFDDVDDFLGITVDQGDRAVVTQGHRENVLDVVVVHLFGGTLVHRDVFLAGRFHVR